MKITTQKLIPELRFPEFEGEWGKVKLKDVSTYFNGKGFERDVQNEGKYELITLKSINMNGGLVNSNRYINKDVPTLAKGTLVMILSEQAPGLLGMTSTIPENNKYVLNQRVAEIRPNHKIDSYFLSMAINRNQRYFSKHGAGMKVQNISKGNVENYEFLCPKLPEQQKIASFLTAIDRRLQALEKKKSLLEQYKKGVMQKIFNYESENDELRIRFKDADGKDFPEWEEKKLGEVGKFIGGGTPDSSYEKYWKGTIPWISSSDIENYSISAINKTRFITEEAVENSATKLIPKRSVLIVSRVGIGKFAVADEHLCTSQDFTNIICKEGYNEEFIAYYLKHNANRFFNLSQGTSIKGFTTKDIKIMKFAIPSLPEQTRIANFLTALDKKITLVGAQLDKTKTYKKGLLQKMFV